MLHVHHHAYAQHVDCLKIDLKICYSYPKFCHYTKNARKCTGDFEKQSDDVTFGGPIFLKILEKMWN